TLAIAQPVTYAPDGNATTDETKIESVDVYIYSGSTFLKREHLTITDFDAGAGNVWTLKKAKEIATTTGAKTIYVGVNLPTTLATKIEGTNPATFAQTITAATDLGTDGAGYAMFSREAKTVNLVAPDADGYEITNKVKVSVARLLAKVVVNKGEHLTGESLEGKLLLQDDFKFTVNNVNKKFFPVPAADFSDPNYSSLWGELSDFMAGTSYAKVNPYNTSVTAGNSIYTTENTSAGDKQGDHTYVRIKGKFVPNKIVKWDGGKFVDGDPIGVEGDFYKVVADGEKHFFSSKQDAEKYATTKPLATITKYTKGMTSYNVFLNPKPAADKENKFDVLRNTIYTVNITKVNGVGEGDDEDTVTTDPEIPISAPTNLLVEIDVAAWAINNQDSELTGK
ncbi:Mfa1 family fimbria major subunit, partial [Bacteroides reticulotermitis]|uniref:Mfa1 family fimbria major subunit n=1 Tax=Bacteroides reticulotermitis TaxID=1133319 RepID=UPI003A8BDFCA